MPAVVEQVKTEANKVVRNLPNAHHAWQWWRNAHFRKAIQGTVARLYAIDVDGLSDTQLENMEYIIKSVMGAINLHVSGLGLGVHDAVDRDFFKKRMTELHAALEGLEQGLNPNPARRPSDEQLMDRFAAILKRQPLNLPDHTDCEPAGTS